MPIAAAIYTLIAHSGHGFMSCMKWLRAANWMRNACPPCTAFECRVWLTCWSAWDRRSVCETRCTPAMNAAQLLYLPLTNTSYSSSYSCPSADTFPPPMNKVTFLRSPEPAPSSKMRADLFDWFEDMPWVAHAWWWYMIRLIDKIHMPQCIRISCLYRLDLIFLLSMIHHLFHSLLPLNLGAAIFLLIDAVTLLISSCHLRLCLHLCVYEDILRFVKTSDCVCELVSIHFLHLALYNPKGVDPALGSYSCLRCLQ